MKKLLALTELIGNRGSEVVVGEVGVGSLSSEAAIACCNCSNLGPLKYLSRHSFTV